jgi:hypothetical protein
MDIDTSRAIPELASVFMTVWWATLIGAVTLGILWNCRPRDRRWIRRVGIALGAALGAYIAAVFCTAMTLKASAASKFAEFAADPPERIVIGSGEGRREITDVAVIAELFQIIGRGESAFASHSHPIDERPLTFPESGYKYVLAGDSKEDGKYWLIWAGYPDSGFEQRHIVTVRQFRSGELAARLERHAGGE